MKISVTDFGTVQGGETASLITLENARGTRLILSDLGARIAGIELAAGGKRTDVTTRFASPEAYMHEGRYHGAVIGRYANRISGAAFELGGRRYELYKNDGGNTLHGGHTGFDCRVWDHEAGQRGVLFALVSPDGEEGYPGTLDVLVTYTLTDDDEITINYAAQSDADTVLSLTNHAYFNLDGFNNDILGHTVEIFANTFTESDPALIPTGRMLPVAGTAMDFTAPHRIGERIGDPMLRAAGGYDHNYAINGSGYRLCARARGESGLVMEAYTDMPGMQFYTANFMHGERGLNREYQKHAAFCMETQFYPDSMAHPDFPSPVLRAGKRFESRTSYRFIRE